MTLVASWGGTEYAWASTEIIGLAVAAVVSLTAFVAVERRVAEPILPLRLFRSHNFTAATALTFLTGFAMFGAVTFLPQFQQIVQGASATNSGLLLLPLMGGMLVTSLIGGQLVTRTGRYKMLLVVGTAVMVTGLAMLSTMDVTASRSRSALFMVVLGVGMGCLMQTTMLVIQNSVEQRDLGAASGAATLFRIGGSIGVSIMGTLYAHQLTGIGGVDTAGGQVTPAMLQQLPDAARHTYQVAVVDGTHVVFLWAAVIAVLGIVAATLIREVPLRGSAPVEPGQGKASEAALATV